jgi:hypothetical protein
VGAGPLEAGLAKSEVSVTSRILSMHMERERIDRMINHMERKRIERGRTEGKRMEREHMEGAHTEREHMERNNIIRYPIQSEDVARKRRE